MKNITLLKRIKFLFLGDALDAELAAYQAEIERLREKLHNKDKNIDILHRYHDAKVESLERKIRELTIATKRPDISEVG